jgi:hypothetical protein
VGSLWHLDFHHGSLKVLTPDGQWRRPIVLGILDDHSRLAVGSLPANMATSDKSGDVATV